MPLTFDLPLEELKEYKGCNPKPDDFDEYWIRGLDEMRSTDPCIEIIPADFHTNFADCFHLYFTGIRGARIHAKLLRPKQMTDSRPAVLMFHGYSHSSGVWYRKLGYVAQGFTVAALDCRGQGGLSEDVGGVKGGTFYGHIIRGLDGKPDDLLYRSIFLDTAQLAGILMDMPEVDQNRVGVTGDSQGGGLALACAALEPRIKRLAPIFPFLCDYKRVWEIDLAINAYAELRDYFRKFDPLHEREGAVFERLGYIDVQHLAERIQGEVLMCVGLMDEICPPSTQFAAYNKIKSSKSKILYPDFGHEDLLDVEDKIFKFMTDL
ncbi:MAG: acetylxylan esterase [Anaerolineales bacterium]|nr:acetylxylan esterase [Anaerolineales bacterium]